MKGDKAMKKLIYTHPKYGHKEAATMERTLGKGKDTKALFKEIMKQGYGGKIPPVFLVEYEDGTSKRLTGKEAKSILKDPTVKEAVVVAPLAGG